MRILGCIFILFFCSFGVVSAQTDSLAVLPKINYDKQADVQPVHFHQKQINTYKNNKDFNYTRKLENPNWWQVFEEWVIGLWNSFWNFLFGTVRAGTWLATLVNILKYVVLAAIIGLLVWLFVKLNRSKAFFKPKTPPEVLLSEEEKTIREKDIPELIKQALVQQNYRLAVRYYYLLILQILKDKEFIDYQSQKTSKEYLAELKDPKMASQFANLTRLYDFIWYGDFSVNQQQYAVAQKAFVTMQKQLNTHE